MSLNIFLYRCALSHKFSLVGRTCKQYFLKGYAKEQADTYYLPNGILEDDKFSEFFFMIFQNYSSWIKDE